VHKGARHLHHADEPCRPLVPSFVSSKRASARERPRPWWSGPYVKKTLFAKKRHISVTTRMHARSYPWDSIMNTQTGDFGGAASGEKRPADALRTDCGSRALLRDPGSNASAFSAGQMSVLPPMHYPPGSRDVRGAVRDRSMQLVTRRESESWISA
jgi:hypothetical protein